MSKIRRILWINFARAERVVALYFSVRSDSVVMQTGASHARYRSQPKTKNFLTIPFSAGGVGGAGKKWKGNFLVLDSPLSPPKSSVSISIYLRDFHFTFFRTRGGARRHPYRRFAIILCPFTLRTTSHWPLAFAHVACSVLLRVHFVTSFEFVVILKKRIVLTHKQICMCLPHPPSARTITCYRR
jgi:hypothetical protein